MFTFIILTSIFIYFAISKSLFIPYTAGALRNINIYIASRDAAVAAAQGEEFNTYPVHSRHCPFACGKNSSFEVAAGETLINKYYAMIYSIFHGLNYSAVV